MAASSVWNRSFYPREGNGVGFDRVVFFSDAVYAIALTLIAVEIGLPDVKGDTASPALLWEALQDKGPRIGAYVVAFVWVAVYWRANHRFTMTLRGMSSAYVGSVLLYLGFVAFLPLPAAVLGEYWDNPLAVTLFAVYGGIVSSLEVLLLWVADRQNLFLAPLSRPFFRENWMGSLTPVVAFIVSIPIAYLWSPVAAIVTWGVVAMGLGILLSRFLTAAPPPDPAPDGGIAGDSLTG
jgi:uncharacterized membrane protein